MLDMIPNRVYRAELEFETIINKIREGRLRWFGHVRRRPQSTPVRRVEALVVDDLRRRGRPKLRWEDRVTYDMKEILLSEDMTSDRNEWRSKIRLEWFYPVGSFDNYVGSSVGRMGTGVGRMGRHAGGGVGGDGGVSWKVGVWGDELGGMLLRALRDMGELG
ncbi:hypothetical protein Tco_0014342 [Tanacetum coccineum]